jgi:hypothetical protein
MRRSATRVSSEHLDTSHLARTLVQRNTSAASVVLDILARVRLREAQSLETTGLSTDSSLRPASPLQVLY